MRDPYEVLGVAKTATKDEIKRAYRKLAHTHHPDKKGGDEEKFKEVNSAYQILSDDTKRARYDQFGAAGVGGAGGGPGAGGFGGNPFGGGFGGQGFGGFNGQVNMEDLGDIFGDLFGGGRRSSNSREQQGRDMEVEVTIPFSAVVSGHKEQIRFVGKKPCDHCKGNRAEPGTPIENCTTCDGSGIVRQQRQTIFGVMMQESICATCRGAGKIPKKPCTVCAGSGVIEGERMLEVSIPAGIAHGQTIRLREQGEPAAVGSARGDLYVHVQVEPDPDFIREGGRGEDIRSYVPLSFAEAALGATKRVRTVHGEVELKIPAGTQTGKTFRLRDKGLPILNSSQTGDHLAEVIVVTPKKLSKEEKRLFKELADANGEAVEVNESLFEKIKSHLG